MVPHIKKLLGAIHKQRFIIAIFRWEGELGVVLDPRTALIFRLDEWSISKSILQYLDPDLEF